MLLRRAIRSLCLRRGSGQSGYSSAITLHLLQPEVTGTYLRPLNLAVAELLLSATYLAEEKGR